MSISPMRLESMQAYDIIKDPVENEIPNPEYAKCVECDEDFLANESCEWMGGIWKGTCEDCAVEIRKMLE